LKQAFDEMDVDKSGTISYKEFSTALQTYIDSLKPKNSISKYNNENNYFYLSLKLGI
jgi:Ca2+-binding EF-hand superfamily protein